jgi:hypothetical protein
MGIVLVAGTLFVYWALRSFLLLTGTDSQVLTALESDKELFDRLLAGLSSSDTYTI